MEGSAMATKKKYEVQGNDENLNVRIFATDDRDAAEEKEKEFEKRGFRDGGLSRIDRPGQLLLQAHSQAFADGSHDVVLP
jgi:hypothetical protein